MKKTIFFTIIIACYTHSLTAQQKEKVQAPSALKELTSHAWIKTHEPLGDVLLEFKSDLTYVVKLKANNDSISGTFSLKGDLLTFETDSNCATKAEYTISVTKETLNFIKKEDQCNGRNEITPGTWKSSK